MIAILRAFLIRDFYIELSYRLSFFFTITSVLFGSFTYFFIAQLIDGQANAFLAPYGGDYFAFVIIGIAFGGYFSVGLNGFTNALRRAQTTGTLEAMMMTPTPVPLIIIGSAVWNYIFTTWRVIVVLIVGILFLNLRFYDANYLAAFVVLILAIIAFASIGILAASIIMVVKRGDPIATLFGTVANLIGGVLYPIEILPTWLQPFSYLLPITYALRAIRLALLTGASWAELQTDIIALIIFCLILFPTSLLTFRYAVNYARADGSLTHY
ncbi:MAG TPA: ABC transporter permease [Anaerolineae bacterium]|nr:ABC transporter permease [Anaerolineae bacterium]